MTAGSIVRAMHTEYCGAFAGTPRFFSYRDA
jgi:hypothetical protein